MHPVREPPLERISTLSIRLALQHMCVQFLQCCYNPIMKLTKDNLVRDRAMEHDDTYYLGVMRFFMEFSRHYQFRVDVIGETLTLPTFHYVLSLMCRHYENMKMQKRELTAKHSSQRLHYAIQAYKELLEYLQYMGESQDDTLCKNATIMKSNILYRPEYRDIFVTIMRNYNEVVSSRALLRDLVETVHIYIRLVEHFCKKKGMVLVQRKRKKHSAGGRRKKELMSTGIPDATSDDDEEDEDKEIADEVPQETCELEFNLKSYLLKFANSHVVKTYCYLLKDYRINSDITNHCVVKMLHRIAFQLKMCPLLYQLRVFKIFLSIMDEPATSRVKEMQTFAKYIVRKYFEAVSSNPIMFVEVLFWKSTTDCYKITEGYGSLAQ